MTCSACNAEVPDEDSFCENCGGALRAKEPQALSTVLSGCPCGGEAEEVDEEGFCLCCGRRVRRPASDHIEEQISPVCAAVSDRGLQHDRNEDRFALLVQEDCYALVICDGVSSTSQSEMASDLVARVVSSELKQIFSEGGSVEVGDAMRTAIRAAASALKEQTGDRRSEQTASTTVVAAVVQGLQIFVAWAGDSRAYWVDADGARLLTRDHSWMNEVLSAGEMSEEEARTSPQAHAITRWIGADAEAESEPEVVSLTAPGEGLLLLCSDGLWNYCGEESSLAELVSTAQAESEGPLAIARSLVEFAKAQGGRDNITVALLGVGRSGVEASREFAESTEQSTHVLRREKEEEPYAESVQG